MSGAATTTPAVATAAVGTGTTIPTTSSPSSSTPGTGVPPVPAGLSIITASSVVELATAVGLADGVRDAMLAELGGTLSTPLVTFSGITPTEVEGLITALTTSGSVPVLARAAVRSFIAQATLLTTPVPPVAPTPMAVVHQGPTVAVGSARPIVKHSLTISQVDERVSELMPSTEFAGYLTVYASLFGAGEYPPH